jgi:hypothetical protein
LYTTNIHTHTYSDSYADRNTYPDTNPYRNAHTHTYSDSYADRNTYPDTNPYRNTNSHAYAYTNTNTL